MAAANSDNAVVISTEIDDSRIVKAIEKIQSVMQSFASSAQKDLAGVDDALDKARKNAEDFDIDPTTDGIRQAEEKLERLNRTLDNQRETLKNYEADYERVSTRYGTTSSEALKLERQILRLQDQLAKGAKKSDEYVQALQDAEKVMQSVGESADKMGKHVKDSGDDLKGGEKSVTAFDLALGDLVSEGIQAAISGIISLREETSELRRDMSFLEENAREAGVSMEYMHDRAAELYAITGDTNEVVEALSNVLATPASSIEQTSKAIDLLAGAVVKFPETIKIESLADSLQETVATGEATGQFAELLERLGVDVDAFNEKLGRTSDEAQRQKIALQTLEKEGLNELWQSYKDNNEQAMETAETNYQLQLTYAELMKAIDPIETKLKTTLMQVLVENQDEIYGIIEAIGGMLAVGADLLGFLSDINPVLLIVGGSLAALIVKVGSTVAATKLLSIGVASSTRTLAAAGPAAQQAGAQFLILATDILLVGAAVLMVTAGIAALITAIKGVPPNITINTPTVPTMSELQQQIGGYASGTRSASPGWAWVGENGPELMRMTGGEEVLTAAQSRSAVMSAGIGYTGAMYVDNSRYIFKVDDVGTYMAIERKLRNEKMSRMQGYAGG